MRKLFLLPLVLIMLVLVEPAYATHYMGGEMSYTHLGAYNYRITARIYHDCHVHNNIVNEQDLPFMFSIFRSDGSLYRSDTMTGVFKPLSLSTLPACYSDPNHYCVEYADLVKTVTLPPNTLGYIIVNQRCCMGNDVNNVMASGSEGLTISCTIPPAVTINSGPSFKSLPPVRICQGDPVHLDFSAIDPEGDSLTYRLATAYRGGSTTNAKPNAASINFSILPYAASFSSASPFGPFGTLTVNPATGIASGTCSAEGEFVVSVACDEYRGGLLA